MNEEQKKLYKEKYSQEKQKGVKFWPDIIYKDVVITFALFIILIIMATWVGVTQEPKADPSDSAYIPRPEWYFMFLFQMLKYFPGSLEWLGTTIIPIIVILALFLLPFFDRNPHRYWKKRPWAIGIMSVMVVGIIVLTILAVVSTPAQEVTGTIAGTIPEQILAGQDLYSVNCTECHGPEGEGGEVSGQRHTDPAQQPDFGAAGHIRCGYRRIRVGQQLLDLFAFEDQPQRPVDIVAARLFAQFSQ